MKKVTEIPPGYYNTVPNYTVERVDEISQSHACTWPSCNPEAEKQEPVAWRVRRAVDGRYMLFVIQETANVEAASQMYREPVEPLFTAPPARAWVGLTKEEAADCWSNEAVRTWHAIEAALKEKNAT